MLFERVPEFC